MAGGKKLTDELTNVLDEVSEPEVKSVKTAKKTGKAHKYAPGEKVNIVLMRAEGKGGERPVPVNYNGKLYTVPRGVPIMVPGPVFEILQNAQRTVYEWDSETNAINSREAAAYPVSRQ